MILRTNPPIQSIFSKPYWKKTTCSWVTEVVGLKDPAQEFLLVNVTGLINIDLLGR